MHTYRVAKLLNVPRISSHDAEKQAMTFTVRIIITPGMYAFSMHCTEI